MQSRPTSAVRFSRFALAVVASVAVACGAPRATEESGATADSRPAAPERVKHGLENTLTWVTSEERANTGYIVYRGETSEGPWYRMTEEPLPGGGTTTERNTYTWVDDTVEPDTRYFYFVRAVPEEGLPQMATPILEAPPKSLDEAGGEGGEPASEEPATSP